MSVYAMWYASMRAEGQPTEYLVAEAEHKSETLK